MADKLSFAGLWMLVPDGWLDVTDSTDGPPALARSDGVGVLQFSSARYRSGPRPELTAQTLVGFVETFANGRYGPAENVREGCGTHRYAQGDFRHEGCFFRVWYVSNGPDVAFVTYSAGDPLGEESARELREAAALIESLEFQGDGPEGLHRAGRPST